MYQSSRFKFTDRSTSTWDTVLYRKKKTKQKNPWSQAHYTISLCGASLAVRLVCWCITTWDVDFFCWCRITKSDASFLSVLLVHYPCWCITTCRITDHTQWCIILVFADALLVCSVVHHSPCGPVSEWCIILVCFADALPELPDSLQCGASLAVWWCITTDFFCWEWCMTLRVMQYWSVKVMHYFVHYIVW